MQICNCTSTMEVYTCLDLPQWGYTRFEHWREKSRSWVCFVNHTICLCKGVFFCTAWIACRRLLSGRRRSLVIPVCSDHHDASGDTAVCAGKWQTTYSRQRLTTATVIGRVVMSGQRVQRPRHHWLRRRTFQQFQSLVIDAVGGHVATWLIAYCLSSSWYCFSVSSSQ